MLTLTLPCSLAQSPILVEQQFLQEISVQLQNLHHPGRLSSVVFATSQPAEHVEPNRCRDIRCRRGNDWDNRSTVIHVNWVNQVNEVNQVNRVNQVNQDSQRTL